MFSLFGWPVNRRVYVYKKDAHNREFALASAFAIRTHSLSHTHTLLTTPAINLLVSDQLK